MTEEERNPQRSRGGSRGGVAIILLAAIGGALALYYVYLHRKPFTQNAFLVANTRPVSPLVEGYVTGIMVRNHQFVRRGDVLFTTFRPPYELRVEELARALEEKEAVRDGADAEFSAARAALRRADAEAENRDFLAAQAAEMFRGSAVSQTYAEETKRAAAAAKAARECAFHAVEAARHRKRAAAAAAEALRRRLGIAKIDLEFTTVRALEDGFIANMYISPGGYYRPGEVLFAFVASREWFVQANFEETDLSLVRAGDRASIWLWQYPGKRFHGVVEPGSWNAERRITSPENGVQSIRRENQWFMLPQRFPVLIRITDPDPEYPFHLGASAYVQIDTSARLASQILWRFFRWK